MTGLLYVYALTDGSARPLPSCRGHDGSPLLALRRGAVTAICSRHDHIELAAEEDHLWRHERVAEALMEDRAVLPVRFGTTMDEDALAAVLEQREAEFGEALDRVRGRVEIGVRVLWTPPDPDAPVDGADMGPGRAYLLGRLHARTAACALADALHARLAEEAVAAQKRVLVTPRLVLSGDYLVERGAVEEFLAAADAAGRGHPDVELLCTGPWPPHTFGGATVIGR